MCCRSCHIGDDGASSEMNQPHQPTKNIQTSTPNQASAHPLTKSPSQNLSPNQTSKKKI